jgi:hypothetical protein
MAVLPFHAEDVQLRRHKGAAQDGTAQSILAHFDEDAHYFVTPIMSGARLAA